MAEDRRTAEIAEVFQGQAAICRELGSPLYGELLERSWRNLLAGGPVARLVEGWEGQPFLDNLPLRWAGALHYLALAGRAPELAELLPSTGGRFDAEAAWAVAQRLAEERAGEIRPLLTECIQTNEVQRRCGLLPGLLVFAAAHAQPLRLLEIGSSAGLNLCMDRYRIELGGTAMGPEESPLRLAPEWRGEPAPPSPGYRIAERVGCDLAPIDLRDPDRRLRLLSFVWPDQDERLERLRRGLEAVAPDPPRVEQARAEAWLAEQLAKPAPDRATLLFHSVMWWYLPEAERSAVTACIEAAGSRATTRAPFGWLRMEPPGTEFCELRLRTWPGASERLLARVHFHGTWVEWL